jgi:hypothetical protein
MKTRILAVVLLLAAAGTARAGDNEAWPCKADADKFCKDVQPGGGRIIACLKQHEADLSEGCKTKGLEAKENAGAFIEACKADMDKLCPDVEGGPGEKLRCLKEKEKDLSAGCKAKMAEGKKEIMKKNPCMADMQQFCKDVKPGEGRVIDCMKQHEKELSEGCKADMAAKKEKMEQKNPCMADMEKLCKDIKPGDGRLMDCLKQHESELSAACKADRADKKAKMGKKQPCMADVEKFCKDVKPGEGRIVACLKQHEAELSEGCRALKDNDRMMKPGHGRGGPGQRPNAVRGGGGNGPEGAGN